MAKPISLPDETELRVRPGPRSPVSTGLPRRSRPVNGLWLLVLPAFLVFLVFFLLPIIFLFALAFNPSVPGVATFQHTLTLANFQTIFNNSLYYGSVIRSIELATAATTVALVLGYPLSFVVAKTKNPGRNTFYTILILISMQLDLVVRMYGLTVLFGNNGLINGTLLQHHIISQPIPLMYNSFGVVVGLVQLTLPFMVLSLVGVIRGINPSLEEAARSLGAGRWTTFWKITVPLSMPGILAGSLLVFAISVSSYVVPAVLGGYHVIVMSMQIYEQIFELGYWQFGAAMGVILFGISLIVMLAYHQFSERRVGGLL